MFGWKFTSQIERSTNDGYYSVEWNWQDGTFKLTWRTVDLSQASGISIWYIEETSYEPIPTPKPSYIPTKTTTNPTLSPTITFKVNSFSIASGVYPGRDTSPGCKYSEYSQSIWCFGGNVNFPADNVYKFNSRTQTFTSKNPLSRRIKGVHQALTL